MEYKAVPFNGNISSSENSATVASQVQAVINAQANEGWEFVNSGNIPTTVQGSSGCFGLGAQPATNASVMVLFFKK